MLRNILKHASSSKKLRFLSCPSLLPTSAFLGSSQNPIFPDKIRPFDLKPSVNFAFPEMGFYRNGELSPWDEERIKSSGAFFVRRCFGPKARSNFGIREMGFGQNGKLSSFGGYFENPFGFCKHLNPAMGFASVAEAVSSTDADEEVSVVEEVGEFRLKQHKPPGGIGHRKLCALLRRQEKTEVEAWEQSVKEYKELLMDMCQQKLAPNLPYMKSLFLGWFEPLRNCIAKEQGLCREGKNKAAYAMYFDQLPADKMAVITMHTLMGLLMTGSEYGSARVVQAACQVGKAIEREVRIHKFLEKNTKKHNKEKSNGGEPDPVAKEQEIQSKRVTNLIKKQKLHQVRKIVKDDSKPWDQEAQAKIGSCLIELLISTAYIQPPVDQSADDPPDIRPAFRHSLKMVTREQQKVSRRYGVIECDPLVRKGLDRTVRHMVIPYMPMLVPPKNWIRYNKGAYLHLPSHVMRTHGARQRSEAMNCFNRAPKGQLQPVFEALDTLGNTKWRVNKRVLSVVDGIWASGGHLACLVDREDVPLPEQPETEDEAEIRKWKWQLRAAKKENSERHSQRCDIELKLAVARKMKDEEGFFYPHNLDFRGRAYPMHPHLNHLGSDLCRGVLEFAEGRPLGKSGLRWLKIHLANLYAGGVDKLSYKGRTAFTENHLDDIFDSADRPLEGRRWWLGAEHPFQCLAVCINLAEALRSTSPETTISHIPVHQDGSCNGLQHYAALGRDKDWIQTWEKGRDVSRFTPEDYARQRGHDHYIQLVKRKISSKAAGAHLVLDMFNPLSTTRRVEEPPVLQGNSVQCKQKNASLDIDSRSTERVKCRVCEQLSACRRGHRVLNFKPTILSVVAIGGKEGFRVSSNIAVSIAFRCKLLDFEGDVFELLMGVLEEIGATSVNLVAGEKPADVYSGIAARVLDIMRNDAQKDPAIDPDAARARLLIDQVDRKLVKQTVMTSVYGVTYIGARDQIKGRLKERAAIADDQELFAASCYAAKTILTALEQMFQGARSIKSWLGDCAKVIASENQPVRWTTPLGLPVIQPYRKLGRHLVKTSLQVLTLQRETDKIMAKKQRTAFPPNFVHSLDGSHMMMTALACKKAGLSFAGVHDSYWTHACDVDEMNRILREKFVELYETPILENLLESFQQSFPSLSFPSLPEPGDFDLTDVLDSTYFFT